MPTGVAAPARERAKWAPTDVPSAWVREARIEAEHDFAKSEADQSESGEEGEEVGEEDGEEEEEGEGERRLRSHTLKLA